MKIITARSCLLYESEGHPESPRRIEKSQELLRARDYRFVEAHSCTDQDIIRVHSHTHFEGIRTGKFFDADTPSLPGMFDHAKLAAGAAIQAAEFCLHGEGAFSLMRPPGHHATRTRAMGFCYFNSIAIAVASLLEAGTKPKAHDYDHGLTPKRVAIVDFDCHHGNGTEEIFHGHPNVLFVSLHQSPCYPGTGLESNGNALNYPLPSGTGEAAFLEAFDDALAKVSAFRPDLLAVSAGFDSHKRDPITQMELEIETFEKIGQRLARLNKPTFSVLEGGYSTKLPECILAYLEGLGR